jgi:hypothetical protein
MATFEWVIKTLDTVPQEGELLDVVVAVNFVRNAEQDGYFATYAGVMKCETPSPTDFTAYPDLTYEQVCGWLDSGASPSTIDNVLITNIDNQINPPIVNLPLPWETPPTETIV